MTQSNKPNVDDLRDIVKWIVIDLRSTPNILNPSFSREALEKFVDDKTNEINKALYHRLAAEAVTVTDKFDDGVDYKVFEAIPLSKLKAIMEIKE